MAKRNCDFLQSGVSCALSEAERRDGRMRRPGADGRERIGGGEANVVMAMKFDREVGLFADTPDRLICAERLEQPERVGEAKPPGAAFSRGAQDLANVARIGAGRILSAERDAQPVLASIGDNFAHAQRDAFDIRLQLHGHLQPGHWRGNVDMRHARAQRGVDVVFFQSAPSHDAAGQPVGGDARNGVNFLGAHGRRSAFDLVDAGVSQCARNRKFLRNAEGDARRLLAIAKRRIIDVDARMVGVHGDTHA